MNRAHSFPQQILQNSVVQLAKFRGSPRKIVQIPLTPAQLLKGTLHEFTVTKCKCNCSFSLQKSCDAGKSDKCKWKSFVNSHSVSDVQLFLNHSLPKFCDKIHNLKMHKMNFARLVLLSSLQWNLKSLIRLVLITVGHTNQWVGWLIVENRAVRF